MLFKEKPYQELIIGQQLALPRAMTAAGMGMGKTPSTLTSIDRLSLAGKLKGPTLIIAPLHVARYTWPDEAAKWDHTRGMVVSVICGTAEQRRAALKRKADIYTINYENIPWLLEALDGYWPFDMVVADESTKLKSFRLRGGAKRAAALGKVAFIAGQRWVNLTGTPAANGLQDLWGQMWFIDQGHRLGKTYGAFKARWFIELEEARKLIPMAHSQEEITARISDVCFSFQPGDWFDIDEPIVVNVPVKLPEKVRDFYLEIEREMIASIDEQTIRANSAAAKTTKCLQVCSGAVYTNNPGESLTYKILDDGKLEALESIINQSGGGNILVAYHWKSDLLRLRKAFPHLRVIGDDEHTIRDWNQGKISLLAAHPASAGHGLNLQHGGNILVFFSHWWNLEEYLQIIERIGPMRQKQSGYDRPVFIYNLYAENTLDEVVMKARSKKQTAQTALLEVLKYGVR